MSTKEGGGGVKNPQNLFNVVYECPLICVPRYVLINKLYIFQWISDGTDYFSVEHKNLTILKQIKSVDREIQSNFNLLIGATNNCAEKPEIETIEENGKINILIEIVDVNDESPYFDKATIFKSISIDNYEGWTEEVRVSNITACGSQIAPPTKTAF